jgi:hypothetical protein
LPRDKEPLRFGSRRAKFARASVRSAAHGNMVSTLRGKAMNIASRGSGAQSIPGFRPLGYRDRSINIYEPEFVFNYAIHFTVFYVSKLCQIFHKFQNLT